MGSFIECAILCFIWIGPSSLEFTVTDYYNIGAEGQIFSFDYRMYKVSNTSHFMNDNFNNVVK